MLIYAICWDVETERIAVNENMSGYGGGGRRMGERRTG